LARLGLLGGSFNPIHFGHLLVADQVRESLALDRVLFIPAGTPPHKPAAELAPAHHRLAMTELAVREHPHFAVSDLEIRRRGPSYTVDTLRALGGHGELWLLIGSETFLDLLSWREPREVARLARLVVVPRVGNAFDPTAPAAQKTLRELELDGFVVAEPSASPSPEVGSARSVCLVAGASLPISGSDLRRRAREGRSLAFRMPASVAAYIREHALYRQAG
jgi:nicotinate-nucleotide adenylyltransferase